MSKYGNRITYVGNIKFDSKKEAEYYLYLKDLERKKVINNLQLQVPFQLLPPIYEEKIIHLKTKDKAVQSVAQSAVHYIADFVFEKEGTQVVVDVKSEATRTKDAYVLKKKMMRALLGIKIQEV